MSYDNLNEEYELIIQNKLFEKSKRKTLFDGFKKNKVINEVLDKPTVFEIYGLIKSHIISYINGVVKAGKESVVFWGKSDDDQDLAFSAQPMTHRDQNNDYKSAEIIFLID